MFLERQTACSFHEIAEMKGKHRTRVGWAPCEFTSLGRGGACLPAKKLENIEQPSCSML
jgi:hypothetical protein